MRQIGPWTAFRAGLTLALRYWPLWLLLYAVLMVLAGLLLLAVEPILIDWIGHRLAAWELADGLDAWLMTETLRQLAEEGGLPGVGGGRGGLVLLSLPAWPFLLSLPFATLGGGILALYRDAALKIDWGHFWTEAGRYAPPFILLLFLEVLLLEGVSLLCLILIGFLFSVAGLVAGATGGFIAILLLAAMYLLVPWWFTYARIIAVVDRRRHIWRALGQAVAFLWKHLGPVAGLDLINFLLPIGFTLLYSLCRLPLPRSWWVALVLLQQLLMIGRIGTRLVRLSSETVLVQGRREIPIEQEETVH